MSKGITVRHEDSAEIMARAAPDETNVTGLVCVYWLVVNALTDDTLTGSGDRIKAQLGQQMAMSLLQVGKMSLQRPWIH